MFKKRVKICKSCLEINPVDATNCLGCHKELENKIYKIKRNINYRRDLVNSHMIKFSLKSLDVNRVIVIEDKLSIERNIYDDLFDNIYLSNKHATIFIQNGNLVLKDLGSTNGTAINGKKLIANEEYNLNVDDVVTFANLKFEVVMEIEVK